MEINESIYKVACHMPTENNCGFIASSHFLTENISHKNDLIRSLDTMLTFSFLMLTFAASHHLVFPFPVHTV